MVYYVLHSGVLGVLPCRVVSGAVWRAVSRTVWRTVWLVRVGAS